MKRIFGGFAIVLLAGTCGAAPDAAGEVRFGKNVRIGGHDVSGQTYNAKRRGRFYLYNKSPRRPGCRWVKNADGSRTKVCHWKRKTR